MIISKNIVKMIIIGDSGCGKTSIMQRFADNQFSKSEGPTIGIDYRSQKIEYNGKIYMVNIWDTAGQERYQSLTSSYYRMSNCVMVVFDLTDRKSFDNIINWIERSKSFDVLNEKPHILVGNKYDRLNDIPSVITDTDVKKIREKFNIEYIEVSAYKNINVAEAFNKLIIPYVSNIQIDNLEIEEIKINNSCCK